MIGPLAEAVVAGGGLPLGDAVGIGASLVGETPVGVGFSRPRQAAATLLSFALLSVVVAGGAALAYRWYFRDEIPEGVTVLLGVSVVALYLNTTSLGAVAAGESPGLLDPESAFFNIVAIGVTAVTAPVGRYAGDRLAVDVFALSGARQLEGELSGIVRAIGRFTAVTLPAAEDIEDMETYDPVSAEKKAELAEKTLLFARKLSPEELRERLVTRVKEEYAVGYVDVDVTEDGTVEYFAVGSRAAGLGPTLAPGSAAVAIAADPPNNATAGDAVQVWRAEPEPKRVATGELRGVAGDAATVALDESDAEQLTDESGYRLVTLPAEPQADREFASLLRRVDETMATVTVAAGSELVGTTVGDVGVVVAAVRPDGGSVQPIPARSHAFAPGDLVYLVGRPDALRRFEAAAAAAADGSEGEDRDDGGGVSGEGDDPAGGDGDGTSEGDGTDVSDTDGTDGTDAPDAPDDADRAQRS
ncbi:TrkA C-terminal domain-containing protein [Halorubrum sp. LN27]|uniref:TrkA C-terminal domain-containing protein n=1 Tax=Halorubrum sp. LN27 TaxID=2801032 RepID=UPI00190B4F67|nr:TrkA C-terminal domain-containing protein [Halorubrum sp. LN27]